MKSLKHKLTALIVCAVMLVSAVIYPTVMVAGAAEWDFEKAGYKNAFDYLMARDGFVYGMDYDWADVVGNAPHVLSRNNYTQQPATYNHYRTFTDIYNIHAMGFNAVNYWMFISGQGFIFDADSGIITGLEPQFIENTRDMLDICREVGIKFVPSVQPHGIPLTVQNIPTISDNWNKYWRFIWDEEAQQAYLDNAFEPLMEVFAEYQDVVICVGLTVENGNGDINDPDNGYATTEYRGTSWANYAGWVNAMHDRVKKVMPDMPTECEEVGGADKVVRMARDTKVDLVGQNYYHSHGGVQARTAHYTDRTGLIGEYNNGEDGVTDFSTYYWGQLKQKFIENSMKAGWYGAFYFSYCTGGKPFSMTASEISFDYDSFYKWAYEFTGIIDGFMNKYRGVNPAINPARLLANRGIKSVYWIPPAGATRFKLERSLDGGKTFTTVNSNIPASGNTLENGLIKYTDNGVKAGDNYCYRVTSYNAAGNSSVSKVGNSADFFVETECVKNGGFESLFDSWTGAGTPSSEQKHSGTYSGKLVADANDGAYSYIQQELALKPNTPYRLKYYYKIITDQVLDPNNVEGDFVRVKSNNGNLMVNYHWGKEADNGWYVTETMFSTDELGTIKLEFNVGAKKNYLAYFDDISVIEAR